MLHLTRANHATLVASTPTYLGMLQKAKDWIAWGEISREAVEALLEKRAEWTGGKTLSNTGTAESMAQLAQKLHQCEITLKDIIGLKPIFRLRPPRKGFKGTVKKSYTDRGSLGYWGKEIEKLILRMV